MGREAGAGWINGDIQGSCRVGQSSSHMSQHKDNTSNKDFMDKFSSLSFLWEGEDALAENRNGLSLTGDELVSSGPMNSLAAGLLLARTRDGVCPLPETH